MNEKQIKMIKSYARYFVSIFSPALTTLFASLGTVYHWNQVNNIIAIVGALTTFVGAVTQISYVNNNTKGSGNDDTKNS